MTAIDTRDRTLPSRALVTQGGAPWIPIAFLAMLVIPLSVSLGPVRLSPYRIVLLAALAPAMIRWVSGGAGPVRGFDICIVLAFVWASMALLVVGPVGRMIEPAGILLIEGLGSYFVARVYIRDRADYERMIKFFLLVVLILFPFAVYETLTGRPILLEIFGRFGQSFRALNQDTRLGLERAQVVFDHSIPFGAFVSAGFAPAIYLYARSGLKLRRLWHIGIVGLSALFSVSGGAIMAVAFQVGLWMWDKITGVMGLPRRWLVLGLLFGMAYVVIDLGSNRNPFHVFVSYMTFSPESAYNRILIFNHGMENVGANPVFGLGFNDWIRPSWMGDSVDNFWLLLTMRHGIPMFVFFATGIVWLMFAVGYRKFVTTEMRQARYAYMFSLLAMILAGITVHYWNALFAFFMFVLGSGVWLSHATEDATGDDPPEAPPAPRGTAYSRYAPRAPSRMGVAPDARAPSPYRRGPAVSRTSR